MSDSFAIQKNKILIRQLIVNCPSRAACKAMALLLLGTGYSNAAEVQVQFKEYTLGMTRPQLERHRAFACRRHDPARATEGRDSVQRKLKQEALRMFLYQSGETICVPRRRETTVGLPVDAEFALFSERLEQITLRFPREPYNRFDLDPYKGEEIGMLISGLTNRYGPYVSQAERTCPRGLCRQGTTNYTYTWRGSDGRITLSFAERPSVPATLKYTSARFDVASAKYEDKWKSITHEENERAAKTTANEAARRARDF